MQGAGCACCTRAKSGTVPLGSVAAEQKLLKILVRGWMGSGRLRQMGGR